MINIKKTQVYAKNSEGMRTTLLPISIEEIEDAAILPTIWKYQKKAQDVGREWPWRGGTQIDLPVSYILTIEECIALRMIFKGKEASIDIDKELYNQELVDQLYSLMKELGEISFLENSSNVEKDWFA